MINFYIRCLRLIIFFVLILISSYYFDLSYRNNEIYIDINKSISNENYRNFQSFKLQSIDNLPTTEERPLTNIDQLEMIKQCPRVPPNLVGPVKIDLSSYTIEEIEEDSINLNIQHGGHWFPSNCTARHRVAIIVPYRDRHKHLRIFLNFMHRFLQKQQLDYQIFLIEPIAGITFNRGLLFNIGYTEVMKYYDWQCLIFHDIDLIPKNDRNIYSCPSQPRHMSVAIDKMNYKLPYRRLFGGVSALRVKQFQSINGYSNQFFGWGGEDDDMANRVLSKYRIIRYPASIARYKMLRHRPDTPNPLRLKLLELSSGLHQIDGLSNLQYTINKTTEEKLFTHILVTYDEKFIQNSVLRIKRKKKHLNINLS